MAGGGPDALTGARGLSLWREMILGLEVHTKGARPCELRELCREKALFSGAMLKRAVTSAGE